MDQISLCRNFGIDAAHQPKPVSYPNQATAVLQKLAMLYGTHPACLGWGLLNEPVRPCPERLRMLLQLYEIPELVKAHAQVDAHWSNPLQH